MDIDQAGMGRDRIETYMACVQHGRLLGLAVFSTVSSELHVVQAYDEVTGIFAHQALQVLKNQSSPGVVYVPSNSSTAFLEQLRKPLLETIIGDSYVACDERAPLSDCGSGLDQGTMSCDVRIEKKSYFDVTNARDALSHVRVLRDIQMDMNADAQVCAGGALCAILAKEGVLRLSEDHGCYTLSAMQEMKLDGFLLVDSLTQQGLQIVTEESHPSAMGIGKPKEGLSVFGLLDNCVTQMGRRLLRLWIMRPLLNKAVIEGRLDMIEHLIRDSESAGLIRKALKQIRNTPQIVHRLVSLQANPCLQDFHSLKKSVDGFVQLREALANGVQVHHASRTARRGCSPNSSCQNEFQKLLRCINHEEIRKCQALICEVIELDEEGDTVTIKDGVCDQLDDLRSTLYTLPDLLTEGLPPSLNQFYLSETFGDLFWAGGRWRRSDRWAVREELARMPRGLRNCMSEQMWSVLYVPQVGFMVRIEGEKLSPMLEAEYPDYRLVFDTADAAGGDESPIAFYYVCQRTKDLDEQFGDVQNVVADLEICICTELIQRLAGFADHVQLASAAAAEIDCLLSLAAVAVNFDYHRPQITEESILSIKNGRHVLTELTTTTGVFVPNDTTMGSSEGRVHVITGPNVSGKSCYIKQVALIVFLAHIGSFVPADEAIIGLTDRIMSLVPYQDVSGAHASSFMVDLNQVSAMLHHSTHRSLLLMDEFGRGTNTFDGVALLASVLKSIGTKQRPPRVLACTHFSQEVKDIRCLPSMPSISHWTMDVIADPKGTGQDWTKPLETQVFLYRLIPGSQSESFGLYCAYQAQVPVGVISRAAAVVSHLQSGKELPISHSEGQHRFFRFCQRCSSQLAQLDLDDDSATMAYLTELLAEEGGK